MSKHQAMGECLFGRETRRNEGGVNILEAHVEQEGLCIAQRLMPDTSRLIVSRRMTGTCGGVGGSERNSCERGGRIRLTMMRARKIAKLR